TTTRARIMTRTCNRAAEGAGTGMMWPLAPGWWGGNAQVQATAERPAEAVPGWKKMGAEQDFDSGLSARNVGRALSGRRASLPAPDHLFVSMTQQAIAEALQARPSVVITSPDTAQADPGTGILAVQNNPPWRLPADRQG